MAFNLEKTMDMTRKIIMRSGRNNYISYLKLLKLLYICDRCMIEEHERSITGDEYYSMVNGPVLSNAYELIKFPDQREHSNYKENVDEFIEEWESLFERRGNNVVLKDSNRQLNSLDDDEDYIIDFMLDVYGKYTGKQLVDITHDVFFEWKNPEKTGKKKIYLSFDEILKAVNLEKKLLMPS